MTKLIALLLISILLLLGYCEAGRHHNNNKLIELLTAGIVAKVLQKQEGGHHGGHEYVPVPIHVPVHHHGHHHHGSESQRHSHHVTEKIIPIPIPHHTTRIIHINAGSGSSLGGDSESHNGGISNFDSGGSYSNGQSQYDSHDHDDSRGHHSGSSSAIQQIFFQDSGVYSPASPQAASPYQHPGYMAYRRPAPMGMMPAAAHPAYFVKGRYPYVAVRQRMPVAMAAPTQYGPPIYAIPYRRLPAAASYMNPMVIRRPPTAWYGR
ncbi:uncharacterized protein [Parasteatoda tepidariorum]|uniref:uncharacterized protein n=1 Tax=Parasteatoda tepidariorum TaxID=114398 RepID=UPI00077F8686|nr:E3 ubiquitin-protein ligase arkadia-C-like [Parasteatoda tepidariorum]